jgi:AAA15 family ATPase/GTPase
MLIQFTVGNFKTFKEKVTLSLIASNYDKVTREEENIFVNEKFGLRILKSAVIYGANASGKSKFIDAMSFMRWMVLNSFREIQSGEKIKIQPFKLDTEFENNPSFFEILFLFNESIFRYGFEVNTAEILSEWLFVRDIKKEVMIFERNHQEINSHPQQFKIAKVIKEQELFRDNALLLSSSAQSNNATIASVMSWFKNFTIISGLSEEFYEKNAWFHLDYPKDKEIILDYLKAADLGINDINAKKMDPPDPSKNIPEESQDNLNKDIQKNSLNIFLDVLAKHNKYDVNKNLSGSVDFSMLSDESSGTRKFFALGGPVFDSLYLSRILVVDELDSKLHPNLVEEIAHMFNSKKMNSRNAQLIFNTHNTNLLSSGLFRRDQIWFTEKDKYGSASLFSLADIKQTIRKNDNFEENYIKGKYGAIPYLGDFDELIQNRGIKERNN